MSKTIYSKNLKYLLGKSKMTQEQFCLHLKVKPKRSAQWFSGHVYPRVEFMIKICDLLNFPDMRLMLVIDLEKHKVKIKKASLPPSVIMAMRDIKKTVDDILEVKPVSKVFVDHNQKFADKVYGMANNALKNKK